MHKVAELYVSRIGKVNWSAEHQELVLTVITRIAQLIGHLLQQFANEIGKVKSSAQLDKASFLNLIQSSDGLVWLISSSIRL
jgi:hypothetical protein